MTTPPDREVLSWELFGTAGRELAEHVAADGYSPDLILAIARGGLFVAGALGYALVRGTRLVVQSLCGLGLVGRGPL